MTIDIHIVINPDLVAETYFWNNARVEEISSIIPRFCYHDSSLIKPFTKCTKASVGKEVRYYKTENFTTLCLKGYIG